MREELLKVLRARISSSDVNINRKIFVFIACVIISFFTWLQINLSKQHTDIIPVKLDFVNLPKVKFGTTMISDTVLLEVESDGYGLLKYEMKEIALDFKELKKEGSSGDYYFLPNVYAKFLSKQLGENFKVLRSVSDTVQIKPRKQDNK